MVFAGGDQRGKFRSLNHSPLYIRPLLHKVSTKRELACGLSCNLMLFSDLEKSCQDHRNNRGRLREPRLRYPHIREQHTLRSVQHKRARMVSGVPPDLQRAFCRRRPHIIPLPAHVSPFTLSKSLPADKPLSRTPNCKSMIEVLDGGVDTRRTTIAQICSPETKLQMQSFLSTGSSMTIVFKRPTAPLSTSEAEYISGYYFFHNGKYSGFRR